MLITPHSSYLMYGNGQPLMWQYHTDNIIMPLQFTKKFYAIQYHFQYSNKEYIMIQNKEFLFKSTFYICTAWSSIKLQEDVSIKCPCAEDTSCCVSERTISFLVYVEWPKKCNECVLKSVYHGTYFLSKWKTLQLSHADFLRVPRFQKQHISLSFIPNTYIPNKLLPGELLN